MRIADDGRPVQKYKQRKSRSRSRSRSQDKDKGKYVTSNTRATIPMKLDGEDKELLSIKHQYLGLNREKKKVLKPSEKFKNIFNFEWDATEDTFTNLNPLYHNKMDSAQALNGKQYQIKHDN